MEKKQATGMIAPRHAAPKCPASRSTDLRLAIGLAAILAAAFMALSQPLFAADFETHSKRSEYLKFLGRTLTSNNVQALASDVDEDGAVFIGTDSGLCRYSGKSYRNYGVDGGIYKEAPLGQRINCILPTSSEVWVGTDSGLSKFNKLTWKWTNYEKSNTCPLPTNYIQSLCFIDPLLIIGTWGEGVMIFNTKNDKWAQYGPKNGLEGRFVSAVAHDPVRNVVWVGTYDRGLYSFRDDRFVEISARSSDLLSDKINCLAVAGEKVFVGTAAGLSVYDGKGFDNYGKARELTSSVVLSLLADGYDMYIGTTGGLYKLYDKKLTHYPISNHLSGGKPVRVVAMARSGRRLYLGTQHHGLVEMRK